MLAIEYDTINRVWWNFDPISRSLDPPFGEEGGSCPPRVHGATVLRPSLPYARRTCRWLGGARPPLLLVLRRAARS
jgi:hypothetical protein